MADEVEELEKLEVTQKGIGKVQIADEVIAIIAGIEATSVEGVAGMSGNISGEIMEVLGRKNLAKGVKITIGEKDVSIDLNIVINFGIKIPEVAKEVQKRVQSAVETMTGLEVSQINLNIIGIHFEKNKPSDADKENN